MPYATATARRCENAVLKVAFVRDGVGARSCATASTVSASFATPRRVNRLRIDIRRRCTADCPVPADLSPTSTGAARRRVDGHRALRPLGRSLICCTIARIAD